MTPRTASSTTKAKAKPVDLKDPKFEIHVRSRSPTTRIIAKQMKNDPAGHWMLTLVDVNQIALAKWEVPESVGTALHKLVELQVSSQSKASDIRRDGMLWGIASYYATVISVFRRYTINLAQQSSAEVCKAVGSSTAKGKGKAGVITWRAPEDWMPPTLKDCVIRLAGNYAHDPYSRALYLSECVRANVLPYSEEQYRWALDALFNRHHQQEDPAPSPTQIPVPPSPPVGILMYDISPLTPGKKKPHPLVHPFHSSMTIEPIKIRLDYDGTHTLSERSESGDENNVDVQEDLAQNEDQDAEAEAHDHKVLPVKVLGRQQRNKTLKLNAMRSAPVSDVIQPSSKVSNFRTAAAPSTVSDKAPSIAGSLEGKGESLIQAIVVPSESDSEVKGVEKPRGKRKATSAVAKVGVPQGRIVQAVVPPAPPTTGPLNRPKRKRQGSNSSPVVPPPTTGTTGLGVKRKKAEPDSQPSLTKRASKSVSEDEQKTTGVATVGERKLRRSTRTSVRSGDVTQSLASLDLMPDNVGGDGDGDDDGDAELEKDVDNDAEDDDDEGELLDIEVIPQAALRYM